LADFFHALTIIGYAESRDFVIFPVIFIRIYEVLEETKPVSCFLGHDTGAEGEPDSSSCLEWRSLSERDPKDFQGLQIGRQPSPSRVVALYPDPYQIDRSNIQVQLLESVKWSKIKVLTSMIDVLKPLS